MIRDFAFGNSRSFATISSMIRDFAYGYSGSFASIYPDKRVFVKRVFVISKFTWDGLPTPTLKLWPYDFVVESVVPRFSRRTCRTRRTKSLFLCYSPLNPLVLTPLGYNFSDKRFTLYTSLDSFYSVNHDKLSKFLSNKPVLKIHETWDLVYVVPYTGDFKFMKTYKYLPLTMKKF